VRWAVSTDANLVLATTGVPWFAVCACAFIAGSPCRYEVWKRYVYRYLYRPRICRWNRGMMCASIALFAARRAMTSLDGPPMRETVIAHALIRFCDSSAPVIVYAILYIVLDWLSYVHAEPSTGFTLWNPPSARAPQSPIASAIRISCESERASVFSMM
jgi:hypothetical protein